MSKGKRLSSARTPLGSRCGAAWGMAVTARRATPHFQNYASKIADLADRTALVPVPVRVA